jgi:hypothetical protein
VPRYMLTHRHGPGECRVAFAAWSGFDSPLRHHPATGSCVSRAGGTEEHRLWWEVEAETSADALALLPPYVAERTEASEIGEVRIP